MQSDETISELIDLINTKTLQKLNQAVIKRISISPHSKYSVHFKNKVENFSNFYEMREHLLIMFNIKNISFKDVPNRSLKIMQKDDKNEINFKDKIFDLLVDKTKELYKASISSSMKEFQFEEMLFENKILLSQEKGILIFERYQRYFEDKNNSECTEFIKKLINILRDFLHSNKNF